jgi:hypothetical protein
LATLFQDNPEANEYSRTALIQYRAGYDEISMLPYPLRLRKARHTGLPSFLNGYLVSQEEADTVKIDPTAVASRWLFEGPTGELLPQALFGIEASEAASRLRFTEVVWMQQSEETTDLFAHVRYQQWQEEWPVFGGGVAVHLATGDRRASVSSSYFPLLSNLPFDPTINETEAMALAQQVLAGYLDGPEAIGLYWRILLPWLKEPNPNEPPPTWGTIETYLAQKQVYTLAAFSQSHNHVFPEIEQAVEAGPLPNTQDGLLALLYPIWASWPNFEPSEWQVEVVPYADKQLFIFPFAGYYHLAYQVELFSYGFGQAWRVFIDAESREALGQPESLVAHALSYYPDSGARGPSPLPAGTTGATLDTDIRIFMQLRSNEDQNQRNPDISLAGIENGTSSLPATIQSEAVNIAFHANEMYNHFIACGADATRFVAGLEVAVGMSDLFAGARDLRMGFVHLSPMPKRINFQTDSGPGLDFSEKKIFNPSFDPEVVYHEVTHGLMWLLNHAPFDEPNSCVPFASALVEGYANYFARSLAAHRGDMASSLWARAAYRGGLGLTEWGDQWSLSRTKQILGEDQLPAPNMYPSNQISGLAPYNVGMVWARALWELRNSSASGGANLTPNQADRLALNAFNYVHGWIANFETAAEGLIDSARKTAGISTAQIGDIINIFSRRCILAERGVQALARFQNELLVGTDAGLKTRADNTTPSTGWTSVTLGGSGAAQGVVALATESPASTIVYAATEEAVYMWDTSIPGSTWSSVGVWPADQRPLCMLVFGGKPYVGTGNSVLQYDNGWKQWGEDEETTALKGLAWQMADMVVQAGVRNRYAVQVVRTVFREQGTIADTVWESRGGQITGAIITSIAAWNNTVYAGTLTNGIWRQMAVSYSPTTGTTMNDWVSFVTPGQIGNSAVLCLAVDGTGTWLWVGTMSGLFQINLTTHTPGSPSLTPIGGSPLPILPTNATVTSVSLSGNMLLVGTASQGLFRRVIPPGQPPEWTHFSDIGI